MAVGPLSADTDSRNSRKAKRNAWTVMIYLSGEKSLSAAMITGLKEMYRVGVARNFNIVVQLNPDDGYPRRFAIPAAHHAAGGQTNPHDRDGRLGDSGHEVAVAKRPRPNGIDLHHSRLNRAVLEDFIISCIGENESQHYLLILSGHGSGVVGRTAEQDGFSPSAIKTLDLCKMLRSVRKRTGRKIDVLGMDSCLMGMCEISWELRNSADYLVSAEGFTPETGWPYHRLLEMFNNTRNPAPKDVACSIVSAYLRYYADYVLAGRSVDLAASYLPETRRLHFAVEQLAARLVLKLRDPAVRDAVVLSHWRAQSYKFEQYVDVWDFCDLLREVCEDDGIREACAEVIDSISDPVNGVVKKSIYSGPAVQHSHGISIYFPWSEVAPAYSQFDFAKSSGWYGFLQKYCEVTRREMRGMPRPHPRLTNQLASSQRGSAPKCRAHAS